MLRHALDLNRKGISEGRATLGLRSSVLQNGSLEKALCDLRNDCASSDRAQFRILIVGETKPLESAVEEQIFLIAREALLNALRHSAPSRVEAEIEYLPRKLRVVVRDDGSGIDPEALRTGPLGMTGMQERAASIGAKVRVWSKRGEGTEVEISLPIHGLGKTA
jgi:signal transduction histidine kinase